MQFKISTTIFVIALICASKAQEKVNEEKTTTIFPTPSTRVPDSETPTTTAAANLNVTTTDSTSTTTAAPSTTTSVPSTTSTTPKVSTTEAPVTTTPAPTPVPEPQFGLWNYTDDKTKQVCIIAQLAVQLNVTYTTTNNETVNVLYNVPAPNVTVRTGECENGTNPQQIVLQWGNSTSGFNTLLLQFTLNATTQAFTLSEAVFELNATVLPNGRSDDTLKLFYDGNLFTAPKEMSYHCTKVQTLSLTGSDKSNTTVAWARVSHVQLEAYHKRADAQFSTAKDCDAIDTPDIVPIAVGCALAALVVIVLIAYLVGRRRAQARGYISM